MSTTPPEDVQVPAGIVLDATVSLDPDTLDHDSSDDEAAAAK